jgi:hypothetical protein
VTLRGLRRGGVTRVDVLVVGPGATAVAEEQAVRHRVRVGQVVRVGPDERQGGRGAGPPVVVGGLVVDPATGEVGRRGPAP